MNDRLFPIITVRLHTTPCYIQNRWGEEMTAFFSTLIVAVGAFVVWNALDRNFWK